MDNMTDLTPVLEAVIALAAALISAFLLPWIHSKTTAQQREHLLKWVDIAVAAAQQLYYQRDGEVRLQYAIGILEEKGFDISDGTLLDAVEAAVLRLHRELGGDAT